MNKEQSNQRVERIFCPGRAKNPLTRNVEPTLRVGSMCELLRQLLAGPRSAAQPFAGAFNVLELRTQACYVPSR